METGCGGRSAMRVRVLVGVGRAPSATQHYAMIGPLEVPNGARRSDAGGCVERCDAIALPPCLTHASPGLKSEAATLHFLVLGEADDDAQAAREDSIGVGVGFWELTPMLVNEFLADGAAVSELYVEREGVRGEGGGGRGRHEGNR